MNPASQGSEHAHSRTWLFPVLWTLVLLASFGTVKAIVTLSIESDRYTHTIVIAPITVLLICLERRVVFREAQVSWGLGLPALIIAAIVYVLAAPWAQRGPLDDQLWLPALAIIMMWVAVFVLLHGPRSARNAIFPLCFLLFMVPVPGAILDRVVHGLQEGSAQLTHVLFKLVRMPVMRDGFRFSLPGIDIEIAEECSGIRSSWALLITGTLAAHLFLRSAWTKLTFILLIIPVAIFKNAVRIVTLSYLAVYVNREFLLGPLHHKGGALFALVGFAILVPALFLLRKLDDRRQRASNRTADPVPA